MKKMCEVSDSLKIHQIFVFNFIKINTGKDEPFSIGTIRLKVITIILKIETNTYNNYLWNF